MKIVVHNHMPKRRRAKDEAAVHYKGGSIEKENNGTYSIYFAGNPYATKGGLKSVEEAKKYLDNR